jgi:YD repeat-containing protein
VETVTNVKGDTIRLAYDNHSNLSGVTLPNGTSATWKYDSRGNCLSVTNPLGTVQTFIGACAETEPVHRDRRVADCRQAFHPLTLW